MVESRQSIAIRSTTFVLRRPITGQSMYGLINRAVQDVVVAQGGEQSWRAVCEKAGLDTSLFIAFEQYPDAQTYALVGAASEVLGKTPAALMEEIGAYWSKFTVQQGYGHLFEMAGDSFRQVLHELNNIHARLMVTLPNLRPPSFDCVEREDGAIILRYYSERPGLSPLVVGLLRGLAARFGQEVAVTQTVSRQTQPEYDEFEIRLKDKA